MASDLGSDLCCHEHPVAGLYMRRQRPLVFHILRRLKATCSISCSLPTECVGDTLPQKAFSRVILKKSIRIFVRHAIDSFLLLQAPERNRQVNMNFPWVN